MSSALPRSKNVSFRQKLRKDPDKGKIEKNDEDYHDDDPKGSGSVDTTKPVETQEIEENAPKAKPN
ncbi:hypothetical protein DOT_5947 [Desulfosporosinus sp. OT]|nr:hypothetical protein DOT_5947 [Desulfosporosinus sp. OT]